MNKLDIEDIKLLVNSLDKENHHDNLMEELCLKLEDFSPTYQLTYEDGWEDEGKSQSNELIYELTLNATNENVQKFYIRVCVSQSGSHHTDWYYTIHFIEVSITKKVLTSVLLEGLNDFQLSEVSNFIAGKSYNFQLKQRDSYDWQ